METHRDGLCASHDVLCSPEQLPVRLAQWPARVISLDPTGTRFQSFAHRSRHIAYEVFPAIRGEAVSVAASVAEGLVTPELAESGLLHPGALGAALSHRSLWQAAAVGVDGLLVMEDDAVTHPALGDWISTHHQELLRRDITYLCVNMDSVLTTLSSQDLPQTCGFQPQRPDVSWINDALARTSVQEVRLVRLLRGFGTCCYFVSPQGAASLLRNVFPLTLATTAVPLLSPAMPGSSIDRRLNAIFEQLQAWITVPFLAYSPNDDSTTQ